MTNLYNSILKKLITYREIMNNNSRDTSAFMNADHAKNNLIFQNISIKKFSLLLNVLPKKDILPTLAKIITLAKCHQSIPDALHLPINLALSYKLIDCQEKSGLTQTEFAHKYRISQSKLSKMESGQLNVDMPLFQNVLHSMHDAFLIA